MPAGALMTGGSVGNYSAKISAELERYAEQEEVHDLPAIYHFWSERYCLPLFEEMGFAGLDDFSTATWLSSARDELRSAFGW